MYILHNHLPEFWADYCVLIYTHHWELMESVFMAAHHCYSWSDSLCGTLTRLWLLVLSCWLHDVFVEISLESHSHVVFSSNLMNQKHMLQIISCLSISQCSKWSQSANWWALDGSCADYLSPRLMSRASIQGTLRTQDCIWNLH